MSLGFREKLKECITRLASTIEINTFARIGNEGNATGASAQKGMEDSMDATVSAILKLIREEVVPDAENLAPPWSEYVPPVSGWNRCREVMLRKLGGEDE